MLSWRYRTKALCSHWSKNKGGVCLLSDSCSNIWDDINHILTSCPALENTRKNLTMYTENYVKKLPPSFKLFYNCAPLQIQLRLPAWCLHPAQGDLRCPAARVPLPPAHFLCLCHSQRKAENVGTLELLQIELVTDKQRRPNVIKCCEIGERIRYWTQNSILYARLQAQPRSGDPSTNFPLIIAVVALYS